MNKFLEMLEYVALFVLLGFFIWIVFVAITPDCPEGKALVRGVWGIECVQR